MCKHLEVKIEVGLIPFYSQTYLHVAVSEQDFGPESEAVRHRVCKARIGSQRVPNQLNFKKHLQARPRARYTCKPRKQTCSWR